MNEQDRLAFHAEMQRLEREGDGWDLRSEMSRADKSVVFGGGRERLRVVAAEPDLVPRRASFGAAGFDLRSAISIDLEPGQRTRIPTGVRIALPAGHEGQVRPRSGLSLKGLDVCLGTVDSDYRGEISVVVVNNHGGVFGVTKGDRIAQLVIAKLAPVEIVAVEELDETVRGEGGFGSTGHR